MGRSEDKQVDSAKKGAGAVFRRAADAGVPLRAADRMSAHRLALALDDIELRKGGKR